MSCGGWPQTLWSSIGPTGLLKPDKAKSTEKIDGISASPRRPYRARWSTSATSDRRRRQRRQLLHVRITVKNAPIQIRNHDAGPPERKPEVCSGSPTVPLTAIAAWEGISGGPTASGEMVSERTALAISTVYTCVTILSEGIASLPCKLMRRLAKGRADAIDLAALHATRRLPRTPR